MRLQVHVYVMFTSIVFLDWRLLEKLESCSERGDVLCVGVCLKIVDELGQMSFVGRSQCDQLLGVAAGVAGGGWGVWYLDDFIGHNDVHLKDNVYNVQLICTVNLGLSYYSLRVNENVR